MPLTRQDYEERQRELTGLYRELWPELSVELAKLGPNRNISKPFLIDLTAHKYAEAQTKLVIVGQQTNGWHTEVTIKGDPIDYSLGAYKDFQLGTEYFRSPFWRASHELYRSLNPNGPENGFIWTNLLKVDEKMGRPKPDVANILHRYFNLLPKEIELAAPDVVVFFTGPNYDDMLKLTFPGITKNEIPDVRERAMTRLECDRGALPQRTYRLYHPKYLNISRQWDLIERIQDLAKANSAQPI